VAATRTSHLRRQWRNISTRVAFSGGRVKEGQEAETILPRMFPVSDVIPSRTTPYVTIALIAVNAAVFIAALILDDRLPRLAAALGLVPAFFFWPALLTSTFLHASWLQFVANMLYLWIFGDNVEDRLGHVRFAILYAMCGAAASIAHVFFNPNSTVPTIGASGAVSGIMGAYFTLYPRSRVLTVVFLVIFLDIVEVPALFFLGIWFLLQLFTDVASIGPQAGAGVTFWAHVVGFTFGAVAGLALRRRRIPNR
jgi:membrane associated rhomboid family serine protease